MAGVSRIKLNQLLQEWPNGAVMTLSSLKQKDIYQQLAFEYEKGGWLKRLGSGVYVRAGDQVLWSGALYAIQTQLQLPIHVGGKSALALRGVQHFIPMRDDHPLHLLSFGRHSLPHWFRNHPWKRTLHFHNIHLFKDDQNIGLVENDVDSFLIRISSLERAILEVLYFVPKEQSFEEARLLMEGLTGLRPKVVQSHLEACRSVKVKRLFLHLAERCNHTWFKSLDLKKIDLGSGKRVIVPGGKLDPKYGITVERESYADEGATNE